jgi:hypothetical protein
MEHEDYMAYEDRYIVGWVILLQPGEVFKPKSGPLRVYSSYSTALEMAKRFRIDCPELAPVYYNTDDIRYDSKVESLGCPNWPNCDVVGCH